MTDLSADGSGEGHYVARVLSRPVTGSHWNVLNMATRRVGGGVNEFVVEVVEHEREGTPGYEDLVPTVIVKATHTRRAGQYGGVERGHRKGDKTWLRLADFGVSVVPASEQPNYYEYEGGYD